MNEFRFAVVVCTRNRPEELALCLESIARSDFAVRQTIVSDDSDDGAGTRAVCDRHPDVTYVEGPRLGLCANRNNALRLVEADWVVFLDDDARLSPDFLTRMVSALESESDPGHVIATGRERRNDTRLTAARDQSFLGFQEVKYESGDAPNTVVINAAVFPAELFTQIGFDESLKYGYDEVDLTTRALAAGYRIVSVPDAVNDHYPAPANRDEYRAVVDASRLYVTYRRYWTTDRRRLRALGFAAAAPAHLFAASIKREGARGAASAATAVRTAAGYAHSGRRQATAPAPLARS